MKLIIRTPLPLPHAPHHPHSVQELGTFASSHLVPSRGIPHATEVESVDTASVLASHGMGGPASFPSSSFVSDVKSHVTNPLARMAAHDSASNTYEYGV